MTSGSSIFLITYKYTKEDSSNHLGMDARLVFPGTMNIKFWEFLLACFLPCKPLKMLFFLRLDSEHSRPSKPSKSSLPSFKTRRGSGRKQQREACSIQQEHQCRLWGAQEDIKTHILTRAAPANVSSWGRLVSGMLTKIKRQRTIVIFQGHLHCIHRDNCSRWQHPNVPMYPSPASRKWRWATSLLWPSAGSE